MPSIPLQVRVILDDLSTRKPRHGLWRKRHPDLRVRCAPTRASRLQQIEIRCSILSGSSLRRASFISAWDLIAHIDAFIDSRSQTARPFIWTGCAARLKPLKPSVAGR